MSGYVFMVFVFLVAGLLSWVINEQDRVTVTIQLTLSEGLVRQLAPCFLPYHF